MGTTTGRGYEKGISINPELQPSDELSLTDVTRGLSFEYYRTPGLPFLA